MPASRSRSTANCLLRRLPDVLNRASHPFCSGAAACPNASRGLVKHEHLLLRRHRLQQQADHTAEFVAGEHLPS